MPQVQVIKQVMSDVNEHVIDGALQCTKDTLASHEGQMYCFVKFCLDFSIGELSSVFTGRLHPRRQTTSFQFTFYWVCAISPDQKHE